MTRVHRAVIGAAAAATLAAVVAGLDDGAATAQRPSVQARMELADGARIGTIRFSSHPRLRGTVVQVKLAVPPGTTTRRAFHGFHVHANDDSANGKGCIADPKQPSSTWFTSADGHLKEKPTEKHGAHAGDLPIIYIDAQRRAEARFTIDRITPRELRGKAVILHAAADNFGNVPVGGAPDQYTPNSDAATSKTMNTGNAGDRIACGVLR